MTENSGNGWQCLVEREIFNLTTILVLKTRNLSFVLNRPQIARHTENILPNADGQVPMSTVPTAIFGLRSGTAVILTAIAVQEETALEVVTIRKILEGINMEWRIFFIGPMGSSPVEATGNSAPGDDIGTHLPRLMKHLVDYLQNKHGYISEGEQKHTLTEGDSISSISLVNGEEKIAILTPFDLYGPGDIPSNVFDAIDDSDLIIADLSGNKPAVIYELAFAHALGIRTIVVGGIQERSFYFSQTRFAEVNFTANPISSADLNGHINNWLKDKNKRFDSPNPLTDFYGAPLPDISAAAGLGAGFYDNFARPILTDGNIVEKKPDGSEDVRPLKGLIVLRPENFEQRIGQMEKALLAELEDMFQSSKLPKKKKKDIKRGKADEIFVRTKEGARIPFFLVDDWMIDIPRTMFSLALSPRLERSVKSKKNKALRMNMESVLIERFFEAVKGHLTRDRNIEGEEERFHYGTITEIPKIIETGKSGTWS